MISVQNGTPLSALEVADTVGVDYPHLHIIVLKDLERAKLITITRTKSGTPLQFGRGVCAQLVMTEITKRAPLGSGWRNQH